MTNRVQTRRYSVYIHGLQKTGREDHDLQSDSAYRQRTGRSSAAPATGIRRRTCRHSSHPLPCDRACLARHTDAFFIALAAHDPSRLPLSKDVKYTETGIVKPIGQGVWKTIEGMPRYRLNLYDPETGGIGVHAVLKERGSTC